MFEKENDAYKLTNQEIKKCCEWRLDTKDNILEALLSHMQDDLTLEYMGIYS